MTDSSLYHCKDCNSDPFVLSQKCSNFDKTLEKFHTDLGHDIVPYCNIQSKYNILDFEKAYTDSAISDLIKDFFNRFKEGNSYKYIHMIDSKIIQSQIIEIDFRDFSAEIQRLFEKEPGYRIHTAFYRAIGEIFQSRFGSNHLKELKQKNLIRFKILNHDLFNFKTLSRLQEPAKRIQVIDVDKEKTVDSDKAEFKKNRTSGFEAYEKKNLTQHFSKDFVSDVMLPAHVYNGKKSCGQWKLKGCLETGLHGDKGGYIQKGIMRCNYKGCKVCATSSIKREATQITNRLMTFCNLKKNRKVYLKKNRSRILLHIIISVPYVEHSLYLTKEGRKKLRAKTLKHLKNFDIDGGAFIDHPYRFSENLESARLSPHFHLIVTGWIDGSIASQLYEKTGWIISNVSNLDSWKDCYSLSKYLLSHSAVFMKELHKRSAEHSVRYFGECHNKKFKVDTVLKHSSTGKEQLDSILYPRKEIEKKGKHYKLQKISSTHCIIEDTIKDVNTQYFESYPNGKLYDFLKVLRNYIKPHNTTPKDNPAIPQSEPSLEFLQMRLDYGNSKYDIVQSVYVSIIFDGSLDVLCPECSLKMQTIVPPSNGWSEQQAKLMQSILIDIPENDFIPIDDVRYFEYLANSGISVLGIPYFDKQGKLQHDTGIYSRPDKLDSFNPKLYWNTIHSIELQNAKYSFKLENGRTPTKDELVEFVNAVKIKTRTSKSNSILNYMDSDYSAKQRGNSL